MIFKFRMLSDETDRFVRDYEVPYDMNLADFHAYVRESVGYGDEGMASIYLSDAEWGKVREFTAVDMGFDPAEGDRDEGDMPVAMERVSLGQIIHERFGRLIYVFDLFTERRFFIELLEAKFAEEGSVSADHRFGGRSSGTVRCRARCRSDRRSGRRIGRRTVDVRRGDGRVRGFRGGRYV